MNKKVKSLLIIGIILIIILTFSNKQLDTYLLGEARGKKEILPASTISVPVQRTIAWKSSSSYADSLFLSSGKEPFGNWSFEDKMNLPGTLLAHLLSNQNIQEVNKQIMSLKPWGNSGSKWFFNPKGGYDFSLSTLTTILFLFDAKPELLYQETKTYLLDVLLNDEGGGFSDAVPGTLGRVMDSENHILMAQGSKYLKNRYRMLHGNTEARFNNEHNGMENGLLAKLEELSQIGLYEFNSVPYLGYTLAALLNLETYGSEKVRKASRDLLDYLCFNYALGSYRYKYYPSFRRRYEKAKNSSLSKDYQTVFMKTWLSFHPELKYKGQITSGESHALIAASMPYRPADAVVSLIFNKSPGYFVKLGHGRNGSPELYSAGPGYLLSAGGVNRGKWSDIVARPVCLFLNDEASELADVFHIKGPGVNYLKWNNTGVYENFACAAGPVSIPKGYQPVAEKERWKLFNSGDSLLIVVYSVTDFGLIAVFKNGDAATLLAGLIKSNPDPDRLKTSFQFPDGRNITFDVLAPKDKWVMISADGQMLNRDFDKWPLISGHFNK